MEQFAAGAEVHLCGKKCCAPDLVRSVRRREDGQRRRQGSASDAITDRVNVGHIEASANGINRIDLGGNIVVPDYILHRTVGRFPRYHKHRDALVNTIFDEAFFCSEVENVESVDPRREDDQRRFQDIHSRGIILDELI